MSNSHDERLTEIEHRINELDAEFAHEEDSNVWEEAHGDEYTELNDEFMELTGTRYNT